MAAERISLRFEKEQDSRKYMTGERYSRIPGEADTYLTFARRARQFFEGTKIQERYLCGPRLEAQLTGMAKSAVERCRPGWLSHEHGVETLLRFLRTHCAKLPLPDMGSHLQEFFDKLDRKKYEPMASCVSIPSFHHVTECTLHRHCTLTSFLPCFLSFSSLSTDRHSSVVQYTV